MAMPRQVRPLLSQCRDLKNSTPSFWVRTIASVGLGSSISPGAIGSKSTIHSATASAFASTTTPEAAVDYSLPYRGANTRVGNATRAVAIHSYEMAESRASQPVGAGREAAAEMEELDKGKGAYGDTLADDHGFDVCENEQGRMKDYAHAAMHA